MWTRKNHHSKLYISTSFINCISYHTKWSKFNNAWFIFRQFKLIANIANLKIIFLLSSGTFNKGKNKLIVCIRKLASGPAVTWDWPGSTPWHFKCLHLWSVMCHLLSLLYIHLHLVSDSQWTVFEHIRKVRKTYKCPNCTGAIYIWNSILEVIDTF